MSAGFGYGQQDPNDSAHDFNVIMFMARQLIAQMSTMKLVKVVAVHDVAPSGIGPAGTVDVQPLVSMLDGQGNATPHGIVYGLPYFRIYAGSYAVICDPQVDDVGFAVCSDRDISAVKKTRAQANPGSLRQFDLADGVYVGGVLAQTPTCYVAIAKVAGADTITMSPDSGATAITMTPGKIIISADEVVTHGNLKNVWDAGGTGFVYQPSQIDTYTNGVSTTTHVPHPPEVPT